MRRFTREQSDRIEKVADNAFKVLVDSDLTGEESACVLASCVAELVGQAEGAENQKHCIADFMDMVQQLLEVR